MKKNFIFYMLIAILIAVFFLHQALRPKVIFINNSGQNLLISGNYISDIEENKKKYPEDLPVKSNYGILKNNDEKNYILGWFLNTSKASIFSANWRSQDINHHNKISNKIRFSPRDFGWRNIIFIIDENSDYHKKMP